MSLKKAITNDKIVGVREAAFVFKNTKCSVCLRTVLLSRSTMSTVSAFRFRVSASTLRRASHAAPTGKPCASSAGTGLRFREPDKAYAKVKAPYFYSLTAGYLAMDSLASVFSIPDFIWQQQGDGEVFVGSWADSFFGIRLPLQLPVELFDGYQGNQSAMIAALPGLRPGATINQGERITSVTLACNQMAIKWTTQSVAA